MSARMAVETWPPQVVPDEHDRAGQLLVGGVEQGGEVGFAEALLLTFTSFVDHRPVDEPAALPGSGSRSSPASEIAAGALRGDFHDRGLARAGPRFGPWLVSAFAPPRRRSRSTRPACARSFYRGPRTFSPRHDRRLVAFDRPVAGHLRRPAHPVQQQRCALDAVPDVEHRGDELDHPGKRPPLVLDVTRRRRTGLQPLAAAARTCSSLSFGRAPPVPLDCNASDPPAAHARRHAYADFVDTSNRAATSSADTPAANSSAACWRTCSRRCLPAWVSPPPSAYRTHQVSG